MKKRVRDLTQYSGAAISVILCVMGLLFLLLVVLIAIRNDAVEADQQRLTRIAEDVGRRVKTVITDKVTAAGVAVREIEAPENLIEHFDVIAETILKKPSVVEMVLAPGCVAEKVLPEQGTPTRAGDNLLAGNGAAETQISINQDRPMLAGPFLDAGDEEYIVGRLPVFTEQGLWGVVGISLSLSGVVDEAFLGTLADYGYAVRVESVKPEGSSCAVLWRSEGEATGEPGRSRIRVFNLVWDTVVAQQYDFMESLKRWLHFIGLFLTFCLAGALWLHYLHLRGIKGFLESLAMTDGLTGLPNRRATMRALADMVESSMQKKESFVLLYMDLNGFKQVNDIHGHDRGDAVLRRTAEILQENMHGFGFVGRVGGMSSWSCWKGKRWEASSTG